MHTAVLQHDDVVLNVLDFLQQNNYVHALTALEEESGLCNSALDADLRFLRSLVLRGRWADAETFLAPFVRRGFSPAAVAFALQRQQFLETLEDRSAAPAPDALVAALQPLRALCPAALCRHCRSSS